MNLRQALDLLQNPPEKGAEREEARWQLLAVILKQMGEGVGLDMTWDWTLKKNTK